MMASLMEKARGAWRSWTVWFNAVMTAVWCFLPDLQVALPELMPHLSEGAYRKVALAVIVGNLVLRFKTAAKLGAPK